MRNIRNVLEEYNLKTDNYKIDYYINFQNKKQPYYKLSKYLTELLFQKMKLTKIQKDNLLNTYEDLNLNIIMRPIELDFHENLINSIKESTKYFSIGCGQPELYDEYLKKILINTQYSVCNNKYKIDFWFPNHNLIVEYDEYYHEEEKQKKKDDIRIKEIITYLQETELKESFEFLFGIEILKSEESIIEVIRVKQGNEADGMFKIIGYLLGHMS